MGDLEVAGRQVWHEVDGTGDDAMVLLHGGFSDAEAFEPLVAGLVSAGHTVFRPERAGHGHSPDVDVPLTYAGMTTETIAYLDKVVGRPARIVGWSDGAYVAVLLAQQRPELVAQLALIGQYYNDSGRVGDSPLDMLTAHREGAMRYLRRRYDQISPDGPEHFPVVFDKTMAMWAAEPQLELADFATITAPTLVLQGDRDEVSVAHGAAVATALPQGRFAVLPGTHGLPLESPELVSALLVQFFRGVPSPAFG
jgi:pimeloyl-ACP methyl ester carboxylesterase